MDAMKCWLLMLLLKGSLPHAGHLLAGFQKKQKEWQSLWMKDLRLLWSPWPAFSTLHFLGLEFKGRVLFSLQALLAS